MTEREIKRGAKAIMDTKSTPTKCNGLRTGSH